jgi:hypothetical protein
MPTAESPTPPTTELDAESSCQPEWRTCRCCFAELPITVFRFENRALGKRHHICRTCESQRAQERRERRRHKKAWGHISQCRNKRQNANVLAFAVREMILALGGTRQFARSWHDAVVAAQRLGRHATVLRSHILIVEMLLAHEELLPTPGELSDAELAAAQVSAMYRTIRRAPDLAAQALTLLGWTVMAPSAPQATETH